MIATQEQKDKFEKHFLKLAKEEGIEVVPQISWVDTISNSVPYVYSMVKKFSPKGQAKFIDLKNRLRNNRL